MIDHFNLAVSNLEKGRQFYSLALKVIGYGILREEKDYCGIGPLQGTNKWIGTLWLIQKEQVQSQHIAFRVRSRQIVDQFYQYALLAGGKDNGKPGLRRHYHQNYYAAFILDPDGHNIEVVCHEEQSKMVQTLDSDSSN